MIEHWSPSPDEALSTFLLDGKARRFSPRTIEHYQIRIGAFAAFLNGHSITTIASITPDHIRMYIIHLQDRGLSSHTVHTCARAVRAFLNFCVREELLSVSPMRNITMPKRDKLLPNYLTVTEVTRLLDACETERERTLLLVLLDTGLRATEVCNLNGGHIDHASGAIIVKQGKGRKDRAVFLGSRSIKQLMRFYRQDGKPGNDEPVFRSERGQGRLTRSGLRQAISRIGERAGVKVSPHKLRRTFATWAWRSGIDIKALQALMGHSDLSTLPAYLGIDVDDLRRSHNKHGPVDNMT